MNAPHHRIRRPLLAAVGLSLLITGCAVSPDYSNYDWHQRGGMVDEDDKSLASAKFEPFRDRSRTVRTNVSVAPTGLPPSAEETLIIDPARRNVVAEAVPKPTNTTRRSTPTP